MMVKGVRRGRQSKCRARRGRKTSPARSSQWRFNLLDKWKYMYSREELHINIEENQNKARDKSQAPTLVSSLRCAIPITMFLEAQEIDNLVAMRRSAAPSTGLLNFRLTSSTSTYAAPFCHGIWGAFIVSSKPRLPPADGVEEDKEENKSESAKEPRNQEKSQPTSIRTDK